MSRTPTDDRNQPIVLEDPQGLVRRDHPGQWLAWSMDGTRVLAVGATVEEVRAATERDGHTHFIYDWVPPIEDLPVRSRS